MTNTFFRNEKWVLGSTRTNDIAISLSFYAWKFNFIFLQVNVPVDRNKKKRKVGVNMSLRICYSIFFCYEENKFCFCF